MASFLPFRPYLPRTLGSSATGQVSRFHPAHSILSCTSTPPSRLAPPFAASLPVSHVDHGPPSTSPSPELSRPSAFPDPEALLLTLPPVRRPISFSLPTESHAPRVWLPSLRPSPLRPSEASFSSQHSWASPFEAFLLTRDQPKVSFRPSTPAIAPKTVPGLGTSLQRLPPTCKAVPLFAPGHLRPSRDLLLPWDFSALQALPPLGPPGSVSLPSLPLVLPRAHSLRSGPLRTSGLSSKRPGFSLPRAPACSTFLSVCPNLPLQTHARHELFFHFEGSETLSSPVPFSLWRYLTSPNGR